MNLTLYYEYQQHIADSEESFTGFGIEKSNSKTWFQQASDKPRKESNEIYANGLLYAVSFGLERDVYHHNRSIYNFLDLLGDIGGLLDALKDISSFIIALYFSFFGNPMQKFLLESVFQKNPMQIDKP